MRGMRRGVVVKEVKKMRKKKPDKMKIHVTVLNGQILFVTTKYYEYQGHTKKHRYHRAF